MAAGIKKIGNVHETEWFREQREISERMNKEHIAKFDRSFYGQLAKADAESRDLAEGADDNDIGKLADHHASTVADLLVEAGSHSDRSAALSYLLHSPHGQALLSRMNKAADQTTAKEITMTTSHNELVQDIVKRYGIVAVCKSIINENRSYGMSEAEFVALATEHAKAQHPDLTDAAAFAKLYQIPEVWRACNVLKSMPFVADLTPLVVGGESAQAVNDPSEAIAQLQKLGRDKWPTATEAQQFANAFTDPANATLAAKAHRRPSATTSYEFPKVMK
jgi:hypothetical protein